MAARKKKAKARIVEAPGEPSGAPLSDEEERARSVGLWGAFKMVLGLALVLVTSLGVAWGGYRFAMTTSRFAVRNIEIEGIARHTDTSIERLAGLRLGDNIFKVDVHASEQALLADPWIYEVKITRQLPDELRVKVAEHTAVASAAVGGALYLVNRDGVPFKTYETGDPVDLPVITGVRPERLAEDRDREIERVQAALEVLRQYERIGMSRFHEAQEVQLEPDGGIVMTVGSKGVTLELGKAPWRKKLLKAARVTERLRAKGQVPGILFLDNEAHPERVVVRMR